MKSNRFEAGRSKTSHDHPERARSKNLSAASEPGRRASFAWVMARAGKPAEHHSPEHSGPHAGRRPSSPAQPPPPDAAADLFNQLHPLNPSGVDHATPQPAAEPAHDAWGTAPTTTASEPAASLAPPRPTDIPHAATLATIAARIVESTRRGVDHRGRRTLEMVIALPGQGRLRAKLRRGDRGLAVELAADTLSLRRCLQDHREQLCQRLRRRGLVLRSLRIATTPH